MFHELIILIYFFILFYEIFSRAFRAILYSFLFII